MVGAWSVGCPGGRTDWLRHCSGYRSRHWSCYSPRLLSVEAGGLLGWRAPAGAFSWSLSGLALLLAATAGHAFYLRPEPWTAHVSLTAFGALLLAILLDLAIPLVWVPLVVALWAGGLLLG